MKKSVDTKSTATKGKVASIEELKKRGVISIEEKPALNRKILIVKSKNGKEYKFIVKAKTSGTWQGSTNDGNIKRTSPDTFWLFVDLSIKVPKFFLVPDDIMRRDIEKTHREYLNTHAGIRPRNEDSTHHAIAENRISKWEGRWDLVDL